MNIFLAVLSIVSLTVSIIIGIIKPKINIGVLAIAFSFLIGSVFAGLTDKEIFSLFPTQLFLMLVGITLFFGIAENNGLLDQIAIRSVRLIRGNVILLPLLFFLFTFMLAAIGPGNIAATAVLAPIGMSLAYRFGISPLLMAIMIVTGANAGAFSPIAPTGVILSGILEKIHMQNNTLGWRVFFMSSFLQSISALLAYVIFKGYKKNSSHQNNAVHLQTTPVNSKQIVTLTSIFILIFSIIVLKVSLALASFIGAVILLLANMADPEDVFKKLPWDTIFLVCGVSVLIGIIDKAGGLELATSVIAQSSLSGYINSILTLITGLISTYSSSSGVVMPAFIPLIPGIISKLGSGNAVEMLIAVAVGSHMVDVSPLSTLGALCVAQAQNNKSKLFRHLMIWGLSMSVFATILAYIFLDIL